MEKGLSINRKYLWRRIIMMTLGCCIFYFFLGYDLDKITDFWYFFRRLLSMLLTLLLMSFIFYNIYMNYYIKKAQKVIVVLDEGEKIMSEAIVLYRKNFFVFHFGKWMQTDRQIIFKTQKYFLTSSVDIKIPLNEIISQESKNTYFGKEVKYITRENKKHTFEFYP